MASSTANRPPGSGARRRGACCAALLLLGLAALPATADDEPTWREIDGQTYGAKPDEQGPLGGGKGYAHLVTRGDHVAEDLDSLIEALAAAEPGETVFIPGETEIDLTTRIYVEQLRLQVPEGVTLAGERGHRGSAGAILLSDALDTPIMIQPAGPGVRITGLRIRGPNPKRYLDHHRRQFSRGGREYYYKFPTSIGIRTEFPELEVDNCEISAFGHAGIYLADGRDHHVHHNTIHHCQYNGLGYGVCHDTAASLIEYNAFDWNRHSIAGTGRPGCSYVARHNVERGTSLSHCFDMHGGRDRRDGTDIAGTDIEVAHNTFFAPQTPLKVRGVPQEKCTVHHNWFPQHQQPEKAALTPAMAEITDNAYGNNPQQAK